MLKRRKLVILLTCGILAALLFAFLSRDREPSYNGRSLSEWARFYPKLNGDDEAIQRIGTNGIPYYLRWICLKPTPSGVPLLVETLPETALTLRLFRLICFIDSKLPPSNEQKHRFALYAFQTLGTNAAPALSSLMDLIRTNPVARETSIEAVCSLGQLAAPAIPILIQSTHDQNEEVRYKAIEALGRLSLDANTCVPVLTNFLTSSNGAEQCAATESLSQFGAAAGSAIPLLIHNLTNWNFCVCFSATNALQRIAPEVLTNAPAK